MSTFYILTPARALPSGASFLASKVYGERKKKTGLGHYYYYTFH